jgi:TRAP-type mannitol/chloroaromatic compound transport system permease small subunit
VSVAPGGLPGRWALKAFIVIALALLALAGISRLSRVAAFLFGVPEPVPDRSSPAAE